MLGMSIYSLALNRNCFVVIGCRLRKDGAMTIVWDLLIKLTKYLAIRTRADRPICTTYKHVEMPSSLLGLILARLAANVSVVNIAFRLTADNLR